MANQTATVMECELVYPIEMKLDQLLAQYLASRLDLCWVKQKVYQKVIQMVTHWVSLTECARAFSMGVNLDRLRGLKMAKMMDFHLGIWMGLHLE